MVTGKLDWPFPIYIKPIDPGDRVDQDTGDVIARTEAAPTVIAGDFQANPQEEYERKTGGPLHTGQAVFYSSSTLIQIGHTLEVWMDTAGSVKHYYNVEALLRQYSLIARRTNNSATPRKKWLLKLV